MLTEGATVRGRVMDHGRPAASVKVGMIQAERRGFEYSIGPLEIGTDAHGEFLFANVPPDRDLNIYGIMDSLRDRGGICERRIHVGADGSETNIGDLAVEPAYRITGHLVLSDGKPLPPHTRITIGRENAWDSQIVEVDPSGEFTARGFPPGLINLHALLDGYRMSNKNLSFEPLNANFLEGLVEKDIDGLLVLLEPGKPNRVDPESRTQDDWRKLAATEQRIKLEPLAGAVAVAGGYRDVEDLIVERPLHSTKPLPKPVSADASVPKRPIAAATEVKPDVAAAIARVEALGGNVERLGRRGGDEVTGVVLIGCEKVRDDDLSLLRAFPDLERLMLGGTAVTDAGLRHAAGLSKLTTLGLIGTKVTDDGMKELAGLNKLEHVRLADTAITDVGVRELSRHKSLEILILSYNKITDVSLADLRTLPELRELDLSDTSITDDGLKQLEQLNNLEDLSLQGTQIGDQGLKSIGKLTNLTRLDVSGSKMTDAGLAEFEALTKLTQLAANNTAITDVGLAHLQKFKSIRTVLLAGTHATEAGLNAIKKLLPLAELSRKRQCWRRSEIRS